MPVAIVYGKSGSGKTVNSTRVAGKNLLMDSDNSSVVLTNFPRPDTTVHKITKILKSQDTPDDTQFFMAEFEAAAASKKFQTIILDNVTDIIDRWLLELGERGKNYGNPSQQDYQTCYNGIKRLIRAATQAGCNVILNFWQDTVAITQPDGTQVGMVSPKMPQKILENICGLANIVAHIETAERNAKGEPVEKYWYYRLEGSFNLYAKDQLFCRKSCMPEQIFAEKAESENV